MPRRLTSPATCSSAVRRAAGLVLAAACLLSPRLAPADQQALSLLPADCDVAMGMDCEAFLAEPAFAPLAADLSQTLAQNRLPAVETLRSLAYGFDVPENPFSGERAIPLGILVAKAPMTELDGRLRAEGWVEVEIGPGATALARVEGNIRQYFAFSADKTVVFTGNNPARVEQAMALATAASQGGGTFEEGQSATGGDPATEGASAAMDATSAASPDGPAIKPEAGAGAGSTEAAGDGAASESAATEPPLDEPLVEKPILWMKISGVGGYLDRYLPATAGMIVQLGRTPELQQVVEAAQRDLMVLRNARRFELALGLEGEIARFAFRVALNNEEEAKTGATLLGNMAELLAIFYPLVSEMRKSGVAKIEPKGWNSELSIQAPKELVAAYLASSPSRGMAGAGGPGQGAPGGAVPRR